MGEPADETSAVPTHDRDGGTGRDRAGDYGGQVSGHRDDRVDEDGPVDLAALHSDDELLTALVSFDNSMTAQDQDPELKSLLLSWRLDVDAEAIGELVDTDTAMATIAVGARIHKRRPRYLIPLATAAAVVVVMFTGMGLAARNAVPGDPLWGISQVLYTDHARSVEAAADVRNDLHHASEALEQGHFIEARVALSAAQASLPSVDNADGKAHLQAMQQSLLNQLQNTTSLPPTSTTAGVGNGPASSASEALAPPASSDTSTDQASTLPTTTDEQPPPPTSTDGTTTNQPPPPTTTTDPPVVQSDTVGNNPGQPADPPAGGAQDPNGGSAPAGVDQVVPNGPSDGSSTAGTS
jgi:hypothetical protein